MSGISRFVQKILKNLAETEKQHSNLDDDPAELSAQTLGVCGWQKMSPVRLCLKPVFGFSFTKLTVVSDFQFGFCAVCCFMYMHST